MNPIEKLVDEHKNILRGIAILENGAAKLEGGANIPPDFFRGMIDFIRSYADQYHHAKEENILFVSLEKAGFPPDQGPVGVMLAEHDQGRRFVAGMENANEQYAEGETAFIEDIVENARDYIYLLRQHIDKEDRVLYPMAVNALGKSGMDAMIPEFERVEQEKAGVEQKYIELLGEFESKYGLDN